MTAYTPIDFASLPNTFGDIQRKIGELNDPFVEMYQREKAIAAWPDYEFIIKLTAAQRASRYSGPASELGVGRAATEDREHPHRHSNVLPFEVPENATGAQEQSIADAGKTDATSAVEAIRTAFNEVLEDGSLAAIDTLLQKLTATSGAANALIDAHQRDGFTKVETLFENWKGHDSDAGMEKFGASLRAAASNHRRMVADLITGASAECAAKLTAQTFLGKTLDEVHSKIDELTTGTAHGLKIAARTVWSEVFHSGTITSLVDGVNEDRGGAETTVGNWFNDFFRNLDMEYELALMPQQGTVLRTELLNAAAKSKDDLGRARDEAQSGLGDNLYDWRSVYNLSHLNLIPGDRA